MTSVLFLTMRMGQGFGVDLVVDRLTQGLRARGRSVFIGCLTQDGSYGSDGIHLIAPDAASVRELARTLGVGILIAHTSPFFELLPELSGEFVTVAWEHGDPTPSLFEGGDVTVRQAVKDFKRSSVYPNVACVVAISQFVAADIGWPAAHVIYNGCDHIKPSSSPSAAPGPLRVGALMRFGKGEQRYKGVDALLLLAQQLTAERDGGRIEMSAMGRGSADDAAPLERAGIKVHLNASQAEKRAFLEGLDVFFTGSLWEGFNLPLVEAQSMGAVGLALDTGAHPETTPFLFARLGLVREQILAYGADRRLLETHRAASKRFVGARTWEASDHACALLMDGLEDGLSGGRNGAGVSPCVPYGLKLRLARRRALYAWQIYGPWLLALKVANLASRRLFRRRVG